VGRGFLQEMMNEIASDLMVKDGKVLVSSRVIAKELNKIHAHVMDKIRDVLNVSEFRSVDYIDTKGEARKEYLLDRDAFVLLVMNYQGYNDFKRAYIQRFNEMEAALRPQLPSDYIGALRALLESEEEKARIAFERDEAVRTKAWISDKKTATAMATASVKSRENAKLKIELDKTSDYATIKRVEKATKQKFSHKRIGDYCKDNGLERPLAPDVNYGNVRSYPAIAWLEVYQIDIKKLFGGKE
jgi:Rha family phage regulatory protein